MKLSHVVCWAINDEYGRHVKVTAGDVQEFIAEVNENVDYPYDEDVFDSGDIRDIVDMYQSNIEPEIEDGDPWLDEADCDAIRDAFDDLNGISKTLTEVRDRISGIARKTAVMAIEEAEDQIECAMQILDDQLPAHEEVE